MRVCKCVCEVCVPPAEVWSALQDKAQPESQALELGGVPFQALLAGDSPGAEALVSQPDADGFSLSSDPLFQVSLSCLIPPWVHPSIPLYIHLYIYRSIYAQQ